MTLPVSATAAPGDVFGPFILDSEASMRMKATSTRYQRYRWNGGSVDITMGFSTLVGGSYVACYVRDPTDVPPTKDANETIAWALAQQGGKISKWCENRKLQLPSHPDLLWTSNAESLRFTSPGQILIVCVAPPAGAAGSITMMLNWDITVSEPSIQPDAEDPVLKFAHTMTRDACLTWHLEEAAYAALCQPLPLAGFAPESDAFDIKLIDYEAWGLGGLVPGKYYLADHDISFIPKFHASGDQTLVTARIWKYEEQQYGHSSDKALILTPMVRRLMADHSGYDVQYVGYANKTGSASHTWNQFYGGIATLHAGTKFAEFDPAAHYEEETVSVLRPGGKLEKRATGRKIKRTLKLNVVDPAYIPMVRLPPGEGNTTNGSVTVTNFPTVQAVSGSVDATVANWPHHYEVQTSASEPLYVDVQNWPGPTAPVHVTWKPEQAILTVPVTGLSSGPVSIPLTVGTTDMQVQAVVGDDLANHLPTVTIVGQERYWPMAVATPGTSRLAHPVSANYPLPMFPMHTTAAHTNPPMEVAPLPTVSGHIPYELATHDTSLCNPMVIENGNGAQHVQPVSGLGMQSGNDPVFVLSQQLGSQSIAEVSPAEDFDTSDLDDQELADRCGHSVPTGISGYCMPQHASWSLYGRKLTGNMVYSPGHSPETCDDDSEGELRCTSGCADYLLDIGYYRMCKCCRQHADVVSDIEELRH